MWKDCNRRYNYSHYGNSAYRGHASWKAVILIDLFFFGMSVIYQNIFFLAVYIENGILLMIESLAFLGNMCYMEYIFIKYVCMRKYRNIDEQARKGDVLSCLYYGNLFAIYLECAFSVFFAVEVIKKNGGIEGGVVSFLIALIISAIYMIPVIREAAQYTTIIYCFFRIVIAGTIFRAGFIFMMIFGVSIL